MFSHLFRRLPRHSTLSWAGAAGAAAGAAGTAGAVGVMVGNFRRMGRCEEDVTFLLQRVVERQGPGIAQEFEAGRAVLQQVNQVLSSHFGHLKLSAIDPVAVFFKVLEQQELRTLQWKKEQASATIPGLHDLEGDVLLFNDLLKYARLADVAYAPDEDFMSQQLEGEWKFLTGSSTARPQRPAHFLAIQGNKVVLAIRGTQTIADCLTDCLCDGEVFHDGFAHRGATEASQWLCQEYGPALKFLEAKGYEVVVVGHSLGAAVAAACCVQLRKSGLVPSARCVCFAPPATVDPTLAKEAAGYITSVVHDDDVIPRLQIMSILRLYQEILSHNWLSGAKEMVGWIREDPQQSWILDIGDQAFGLLETRLESHWKEQSARFREELKQFEAQSKEIQPLSIPGFIVHLYRCPAGYGVIKAPPESFSRIELSSSMVADHFLDAYIESLQSVLQAAEASHREKLQALQRLLPEGPEAAEAFQQFAEISKSVHELVLKARSTLQARPDTS